MFCRAAVFCRGVAIEMTSFETCSSINKRGPVPKDSAHCSPEEGEGD